MANVDQLGRRNSGAGMGVAGQDGAAVKSDVDEGAKKLQPGAGHAPEPERTPRRINLGSLAKAATVERVEPAVADLVPTPTSSSSSSLSSSSSPGIPVASSQSAAGAPDDKDLVKALFATHTAKEEFSSAAAALSKQFSSPKHPWAARVAAVQSKGVAVFEGFVNLDQVDKMPADSRAVLGAVLKQASMAFDQQFPRLGHMSNPAIQHKLGFLTQVLGRLLGRAAVPEATTDVQKAFRRLTDALPASRQAEVITMTGYFALDDRAGKK
jgi:hypothetical protein